MTITKEKFEAFVEVQRSGVTNMFDVKAVSELSDDLLSTDEVKEIMNQYDSLMEQYPEVYN